MIRGSAARAWQSQIAVTVAFLTYAVTGVLIVLLMRMLGEMATANPSTGSFAD